MTQPVIITVAITGALPQKKDNPAVPVTPDEQIESTHEARRPGIGYWGLRPWHEVGP